MNLIDCYVTKILGEPYRKFGYWWVDVEYESEGRAGTTKLMFGTRKSAREAKAGFQFLA